MKSEVTVLDDTHIRWGRPYIVRKVFEGAGLKHAIKRAIRFMLNKGFDKVRGIPNHINTQMAAFKMADPDGFKRVIERAPS